MLDELSRVYFGTNKIIQLSERETQLLAILIANKDNVTSVNEAIRKIYPTPPKNPIGCITKIVFQLRHKIKGEIEIITMPFHSYKIRYVGGVKNANRNSEGNVQEEKRKARRGNR